MNAPQKSFDDVAPGYYGHSRPEAFDYGLSRNAAQREYAHYGTHPAGGAGLSP
jgi:hypothetical protein